MKRGIKSSENREHGPLRGLGAVGLPHMVPAPPLSTSYHIWRSTFLTRTDQSIVHTGNIHGSLGDTMLMELME
jgi:hypothetical protein